RPLLARDRFPLVALDVRLPLADVDVNVHPTKAWVRFRHPRLVQEMVVAALGEALRRRAMAPGVDTGGHAPGVAAPRAGETAPPDGGGPAAFGPGLAGQALFEATAPYVAADLGRVLGQVQDTFVVAATDNEVFFVDQHAAHERVVFERLQADLAAGAPAAQALLFPEPLDLAPAARALLERWREPLERLGFAFEDAGGRSVVLRAVPAVLQRDEPRRLVEAAVDELAAARPGELVIDRVLSFVACRAAIKANTPLEREEMERLVAELGATAAPYFCPHGRPTMSRVSIQDIRRDVRRAW
ncbi:MAG TPA: hypothetical protein VLF19_04870, partial [Methylomirabilota bacterium]|nr:hypothetical protein [Methylomirabilota bacterium]